MTRFERALVSKVSDDVEEMDLHGVKDHEQHQLFTVQTALAFRCGRYLSRSRMIIYQQAK